MSIVTVVVLRGGTMAVACSGGSYAGAASSPSSFLLSTCARFTCSRRRWFVMQKRWVKAQPDYCYVGLTMAALLGHHFPPLRRCHGAFA